MLDGMMGTGESLTAASLRKVLDHLDSADAAAAATEAAAPPPRPAFPSAAELAARERAAAARARYEAQFGLPSSPLSASSGADFDT